MNYYVVVEGQVEKIVYQNWIKFVNPKLNLVDYPHLLQTDNYYIISGGGYPQYEKIVVNAIADIGANLNPVKLVVILDAEEQTLEDKFTEVESAIHDHMFSALNYSIVIQYFCFETWALGNLKLGPRNPNHVTLIEYRRFFDVLINDPEELPPYKNMSRIEFSLAYLRKMIADKGKNRTYSKSNPTIVASKEYFDQIHNRFLQKNHLKSFSTFLNAFI